MLKKSLPAYYILIAVLLGALIPSCVLFKSKLLSKDITNQKNCNEYKIARLNGYKYVKPLVYAETACEAKRYDALKQKIEQVIQDYKKQNKLNGASVYLRDFRLGEWTLIGENERFAPGSLIKVPIMMTYLKAYEHDTKILDQKFVFNTPFEGIPVQNIKDRSIEMGKEYSVKELLKYMIAYSDNNATAILANNINFEVYKKVFTDLGLPEPKIQDSNFSISAKEYSIFIKALYNASYLTIDNSEFGASLMGECTFKDGLSKGFPSDTKFAHKFGETGNALERQLHESGIIYLKNDSYMLTVMTKGKDLGQLSSILAAISKLVYDEMQGKSS